MTAHKHFDTTMYGHAHKAPCINKQGNESHASNVRKSVVALLQNRAEWLLKSLDLADCQLPKHPVLETAAAGMGRGYCFNLSPCRSCCVRCLLSRLSLSSVMSEGSNYCNLQLS